MDAPNLLGIYSVGIHRVYCVRSWYGRKSGIIPNYGEHRRGNGISPKIRRYILCGGFHATEEKKVQGRPTL
jgi:hypothetical protein